MPDDRRDSPDAAPPLSREARLAAKLRENLRRRKVQARGLTAEPAADPADDLGTLPKSPGKS